MTALPQNKVFERARLSRDARFDGHFFVAVRTTGIYCRPICPANSPKSENISFYPSAAAAGEAGFRPCLRCRPECAPGTPAWHGTSTTVRRGLRLIAGGALDNGNIEQLAERLGVTSRHLRRLFTKHLGASPLAVAHTQRLHFAKRLIDQTSLAMQDVAVAAGYGSVRRFNDAFQRTYGRPPRELRRKHKEWHGDADPSGFAIRLSYRTPFDWAGQLAFFEARAIPGVEVVVDDNYWRSVRVDNHVGALQVGHDDKRRELAVRLHGIETVHLYPVVQRVREMFDLDAPVSDIASHFNGDALLRAALRRQAGIRVPGCWDGYELTIRAILGQQVSVKAATTLSGRIAERYGTPFEHTSIARLFPSPGKLMRARMNDMGLTGARAETIRRVSRAVVSGDVSFDAAQDPAEFCRSLLAIRGIGDWTAQYVAMRRTEESGCVSGIRSRFAQGTG